jgi:hypothetical protein
MEEKCILVGTALVNVIHPFLYVGGGGNQWMAVNVLRLQITKVVIASRPSVLVLQVEEIVFESSLFIRVKLSYC